MRHKSQFKFSLSTFQKSFYVFHHSRAFFFLLVKNHKQNKHHKHMYIFMIRKKKCCSLPRNRQKSIHFYLCIWNFCIFTVYLWICEQKNPSHIIFKFAIAKWINKNPCDDHLLQHFATIHSHTVKMCFQLCISISIKK